MVNLDFLTLKQRHSHCCKNITPQFFVPSLRVQRTHSHHLLTTTPSFLSSSAVVLTTTVLHLHHLFVYLFSLFSPLCFPDFIYNFYRLISKVSYHQSYTDNGFITIHCFIALCCSCCCCDDSRIFWTVWFLVFYFC